ncbi:MAG TPA: ATP synthase F0 subunit C [Kofleriaceae bacterium]|nr:ATP synthase F0 subunit C [Kofleriaceae bacterium]
MREIFLVLAPALAIVPAAVAASLSMRTISQTALEGITRQPAVSSQLFTTMLVSMALVEALVIYCLVIALMLAGKI